MGRYVWQKVVKERIVARNILLMYLRNLSCVLDGTPSVLHPTTAKCTATRLTATVSGLMKPILLKQLQSRILRSNARRRPNAPTNILVIQIKPLFVTPSSTESIQCIRLSMIGYRLFLIVDGAVFCR